MKEECLICKAPLEYLKEDMEMECELCHKKEKSKTRCVNGHYVCNECHMQGIDSLVGICMEETSGNPVIILDKMMSQPFCHMHGPEHHIMVGMALLTAYRNSGGDIDLEKGAGGDEQQGKIGAGRSMRFLGRLRRRNQHGNVPFHCYRFYTPWGKDNFGLSHRMTASALEAIGEVGGPRCCKRDSYLSILRAVDFVRENLGNSRMERPKICCSFSSRNNQCIGSALSLLQEGKRRSPLSASTIPAGARSRKRLGNSICPISVTVIPPGTEVRPQINQDAVRLMKREYGIDMERDQYVKLLSDIPEADIYVSMGCNVACPNIPGKEVINWGLEDPTGKQDSEFMDVIRQIEKNVRDFREREEEVNEPDIILRGGEGNLL